MSGAEGGTSIGTTPGPNNPGYGGRLQGVVSVTPGEILNLYVGGEGSSGIGGTIVSGGWNGGGNGGPGFVPGPYGGGGGGGASDIRIGGVALTDRVMIAGGGGGAAFNYFSGGDHGGNGGGVVGDDGLSGGGMLGPVGIGGNQIAGGAGGGWPGYLAGQDGVFGIGGNAGVNGAGGGGGGGWYGGGGGSWAGGGGGSSFVDTSSVTGTIHTSGYNEGDGYILITEISILPIELYSFTCYYEHCGVQLNWLTLSEINNDYFIIEHSIDAEIWNSVDTINGAGNSAINSSYGTYHSDPDFGINYYRLSQVDFNGKQRIVGIESIWIDPKDILVYPNPCSDILHVRSNKVNFKILGIYDFKGSSVMTYINVNAMSHSEYLIEIDRLSAGIYFIHVNNEFIKFIKY